MGCCSLIYGLGKQVMRAALSASSATEVAGPIVAASRIRRTRIAVPPRGAWPMMVVNYNEFLTSTRSRLGFSIKSVYHGAILFGHLYQSQLVGGFIVCCVQK
jgi:hypothetical protein